MHLGEFKERPCPFCGHGKYTEAEPFQNRYGVARCLKCNSLYVNPCPTQEVLNDYYNNYECNDMLEKVYKERAEKPRSTILGDRLDTIVKYIGKTDKAELHVFTTPNDASVEMRSISYNVPRVLACNIYPPMHLNAFSTNNISYFVFRSGFCVMDISTPGSFDVEILELEKEHLSDTDLLKIGELTEGQKEMLQQILVKGGASSHLQCVVTKEKQKGC